MSPGSSLDQRGASIHICGRKEVNRLDSSTINKSYQTNLGSKSGCQERTKEAIAEPPGVSGQQSEKRTQSLEDVD